VYAVPHTVTITDRAAAEAGLEQAVPMTSSLPGFVAGYWLARAADQGLAVIVFETEEAAQSYADMLHGVPDAPGVTIDQESIGVCPVLAHA
jgi:hypothetical protein